MTDLYDNPMGLMGFEFVEFASPTPNTLEPLFQQLGMTAVQGGASGNLNSAKPAKPTADSESKGSIPVINW